MEYFYRKTMTDVVESAFLFFSKWNKATKVTFDKERWKDKECYRCHKERHPSSHCTSTEDDGDVKCRASNGGVKYHASGVNSQARSVKKLEKQFKSMKKAFTQLQEMREDTSDILDSEASEGDSQGDSHFQIDVDGFQFVQVDKEFEPQIAKLFEQAWRNTKYVRNNVNLGCDKNFIFVETVSGNKQGSTQRQIKGAEVARTLYAQLSYPSWKDFKWVIRSNQIKDCPMTVQDVDVALKIWGKNIVALKGNTTRSKPSSVAGKTTRSKPNPVARDFVKVPVELLKLHNTVRNNFTATSTGWKRRC
jgi:hypothetical protein